VSVNDRIPNQRYAEALTLGLSYLPTLILRRLTAVRIVCGVDPVFAGLTRTVIAADGRSYRDTPHVCWPIHLRHRPADDRQTTVMFPTVPHPVTVAHELGHALDWSLGRTHTAVPVTDYARTNRDEAFAEAFTAWMFKAGYYGDADVLYADGATVRLFDDLAAS
jgi:hypothetical protein